MFESSRQLFEIYFFRLVQRGAGAPAVHLSQDIRAHLRRLYWIHEQACALNRKLLPQAITYTADGSSQSNILLFLDNGVPEKNPLRIATLPPQDEDQLLVFVESFYHTAHRV